MNNNNKESKIEPIENNNQINTVIPQYQIVELKQKISPILYFQNNINEINNIYSRNPTAIPSNSLEILNICILIYYSE